MDIIVAVDMVLKIVHVRGLFDFGFHRGNTCILFLGDEMCKVFQIIYCWYLMILLLLGVQEIHLCYL